MYPPVFIRAFTLGRGIKSVFKRNENYDVHRKISWMINYSLFYNKYTLFYTTKKTAFCLKKVCFILSNECFHYKPRDGGGGGGLNIKMPSHQHSVSYDKGKRLPYIHYEIPYTWKGPYIETGSWYILSSRQYPQYHSQSWESTAYVDFNFNFKNVYLTK